MKRIIVILSLLISTSVFAGECKREDIAIGAIVGVATAATLVATGVVVASVYYPSVTYAGRFGLQALVSPAGEAVRTSAVQMAIQSGVPLAAIFGTYGAVVSCLAHR